MKSSLLKKKRWEDPNWKNWILCGGEKRTANPSIRRIELARTLRAGKITHLTPRAKITLPIWFHNTKIPLKKIERGHGLRTFCLNFLDCVVLSSSKSRLYSLKTGHILSGVATGIFFCRTKWLHTKRKRNQKGFFASTLKRKDRPKPGKFQKRKTFATLPRVTEEHFWYTSKTHTTFFFEKYFFSQARARQLVRNPASRCAHNEFAQIHRLYSFFVT